MRHLELSRDIRAAWQYNNLCYNVLGLLIERLSGQSYRGLHARAADRQARHDGQLHPRGSRSLGRCRPAVHDARGHAAAGLRLPIRTMAGGAINTSVADLANWMRLHLGKGEFDGERLLPAALIDALHAPRVYNSITGLC